MGELIIPTPLPPQLTEAADATLKSRILDHGIERVWDVSLMLFRERFPSLTDYVKRYEFERGGVVLEDDKPVRVFRTAAVVTGIAYMESGFEPPVEDTFSFAELDAELSGVPKVFIERYFEDSRLRDFMSFVLEAPQLQEGIEEGSYEEIVAVGAGCTRHFMLHALAA